MGLRMFFLRYMCRFYSCLVLLVNISLQSGFYFLVEVVYKGKFFFIFFIIISNDYYVKFKCGFVCVFFMDVVIGFEEYVNKCIFVFFQCVCDVFYNGKKFFDFVVWMQYFVFDVLGEINFFKDFGFFEVGVDKDGIIVVIGQILGYVLLIG